ncbi:hypothetical protein NYE69_31895 [Paenibacillus sp. FSL R5-0527]|nr:hypothetical protein BK140_24500 [Paenibacillus macerans]
MRTAHRRIQAGSYPDTPGGNAPGSCGSEHALTWRGSFRRFVRVKDGEEGGGPPLCRPLKLDAEVRPKLGATRTAPGACPGGLRPRALCAWRAGEGLYGRPIRSRVEPRAKRLCSEKLQGRFFVSVRRLLLEISNRIGDWGEYDRMIGYFQ